MPWDTPPTVASPETVSRAAEDEMQLGGLRLLKALQDGSAVDTGRFRRSWNVDNRGDSVIARNSAPYERYAPLDTTDADRVADDLSRRLGATVNNAIAEGG